jgi:mRNA interferase MazF
MTLPNRGDVWLADLDPVRGHEQARRRPVLVISDDGLNHSEAGLSFVIPLSTRSKDVPSHVLVAPPEAGLRTTSYVMCEHMRSIAHERLIQSWGSVSSTTLAEVEYRLRVLLSL